MSKSTSNFLELLKVGLHGFSALLKGLDFGDGSGVGAHENESWKGNQHGFRLCPQDASQE